MLTILAIISLSLFITFCFTIFLVVKNKTINLKLSYIENEYGKLLGINKNLEEDIKHREAQFAQISNENIKLKSAADFNTAKSQELQEEISKLMAQNDQLKDNNNALLTENKLIQQQNKNITEKFTDWEKNQQETIKNTKAAILEVGHNLSNKLLEDHKREAQEQSEESKKIIAKTQKEINEQFNNVVKSVSTLESRVRDSQNTVDIVKRSLLSPGGAGSLAEITLGNILKSSGLIENQDYFLQYHMAGNESNNLRPDAVIALPSNNKMIIDSKASKFFFEIGQAAEEDQHNIKNKLKETINNHVRDLLKKDYREALKKFLNKQEDISQINITMVMFLPTDNAITTILEVIPNFYDKCWANNIYPCGPSGLVNMLAHAKFQILQVKQAENYQKVLIEVQELLNNIATFADHAGSLGNSINQAVKHYDKFAASFNRHLLARAKNLNKLGIIQSKNKSLPSTLERYQTITVEHQASLLTLDDK